MRHGHILGAFLALSMTKAEIQAASARAPE